MTTIPSSPAPPPAPAPGAAAPAGPVLILQQAAPALQQLPAGATLEAVVVRAQAEAPPQTAPAAEGAPPPEERQVVTLRTSAGDVAVRTSVPLDEGAKVALQILRSAGGDVAARVVTVDGQPAQQALAQALRERAGAAAAAPAERPPAPLPNPTQSMPLQPGQAWTPTGPAPLTAVAPLSAFVINAAPAPLALQAGPIAATAPFPTATDLAIRVVGVQLAASPPGAPAAPPAGRLTSPSGPITPQVAATLPNAAPPAPGGAAVSPGAKPLAALASSPPAMTATPPSGANIQSAASRATGPTSAVAAPAAGPVAGTGTTTPAPIPGLTATEPQGLKLAGPQGLGPLTPAPPRNVEAPTAVTRLTGQVTSVTPGGAALVQTSAGEIQINIRANLPVGSTVTFDVIGTAPPRPMSLPPEPATASGPAGQATADTPDGAMAARPATPSAPTPAPAGLPLSTPAMGWSSLGEAVQLLQRADPQLAAQLVNAIPDGGPRTAVAAMAFVQAMRSGDARQWPGDTALRGLERAGPRGAQLAAQISGEVRELAARAADSGAEWRTMPMPWNADGRIERVALILRRENSGDDEGGGKAGGKGKGTRFLVNLDLSRLGEMQLDGMFAKSTRTFEMMIRTKQPLPDHMRRDLAGLFANANAAMGLKGGLNFQVVKKFPDPTAASPQDRAGVWA